jgi:two-component system alkaline phosphatase synthesis response regulator PhoP
MTKTILIVDDEPDFLKVLSFGLKMAGYNIVTASDGQEALDAIFTIKPDLILLDLMIPKISGEALCKRLKADLSFNKIPIILLTALMCDSKEKVKETGADGYLEKPFSPDELKARIKGFIG